MSGVSFHTDWRCLRHITDLLVLSEATIAKVYDDWILSCAVALPDHIAKHCGNDQSYEPTQQEVLEYAVRLGMVGSSFIFS